MQVSRALLMMNLHAHLSTFEVIGLVGGKVISEEEIIIEEAMPCTNISASSNAHSVEMDPASQVESQEQLENMGYKNLGWYHSHPVFKTTPSQIDQETHLNHQNFYKDHPYLGIIIGPYNTERGFSKTKGEVFVFNVLNNQTYKLDYQIKPSPYLEQRDVLEIEKIIKENMPCRKAVRLNQNWKKGITYRDKILSCLVTLLTENASQFKPQLQPSPLVQDSPQESKPIEEEKQAQTQALNTQKSAESGEILEVQIEMEEVKPELEIKKGEDESDVKMEEIEALKQKERVDLSSLEEVKVLVAFLELLLQQDDN